MHTAITRLPAADLAGCELTCIERSTVDPERAAKQHAGYRERLADLGVSVVALPPEPGLPDAVFVEDPALVLPEVAIVTRPGAPSRRPECETLATALADHRPVLRMEAPCTLDGGDVMRTDDLLWVAMSTRTNHAGLKALAHLVLPYGYRVKAIETRGCLHLKTGCTHLGGELVVANREWIDASRLDGFDIVDVDPREPFGANTLRVGEVVLCSASFPRTAERIASRGLRVETVKIEELEKMEAGVTCLSLLFES